MNRREIRILCTANLELRDADGGARKIHGYAAKFDVLSENLGGFRETIKAGAFTDVLGDDVRALLNHDPNLILGRTKANTLALGEDEVGLWYETTLPETQVARDLAESISRGDVSQSSFAFTVAPGGEDWQEDEDGRVIRTITKIGRLYDVSPVTYPAYPDTTIGMRGFDGGERAMEEYRTRKTEAERARNAEAYQQRKRQERNRFLRLKAVRQ